jgi:hypothetical protein
VWPDAVVAVSEAGGLHRERAAVVDRGAVGGPPEADTALRDRLDALYGTAQPAPVSTVVHLRRRAGRGPSVAPGGPGDDERAADDAPATL